MSIEIRDPKLVERIQHLAESHGLASEEILARALNTQEEQDRWLADQRLPNDAKIARGIAQLDRGEGIPAERVPEYLKAHRERPE